MTVLAQFTTAIDSTLSVLWRLRHLLTTHIIQNDIQSNCYTTLTVNETSQVSAF